MQLEHRESWDFWSHSLGLSYSRSPSIGGTPIQYLASPYSVDVAHAGIRFDLHQSLTANLPWFQLLTATEEDPGRPTTTSAHGFVCLLILHIAHRSRRSETPAQWSIHCSQGTTSPSNLIERRKVLSDLLGFPAQSVTEFATRFQGYIPERREGDLSGKLERFLDTSSPATSALPALFALTAFFASNNGLDKNKMDGFLQWIVKNRYLAVLQRFMDIPTPTVHAFAKYVLESAIRIKSIPVLSELLDRGVNFASVAEEIASIGDHDLTRRVLMTMDPQYFKKEVGIKIFHRFVNARLFELAEFLLGKGVPVDARDSSRLGETALFAAICDENFERARFLIVAGADILAHCPRSYQMRNGDLPITQAVFRKNTSLVALMLTHYPGPGSSLTGKIHDKPMVQWASIHCKQICQLLVKHGAPGSQGSLLGDLLDSAILGPQALAAYAQKQPGGVPQPNMEQALEESIKGDHFAAAMTLLEHGVDPNGLMLANPPIQTALELKKPGYVDLLLQYKANLTAPGLLSLAVGFQESGVLRRLLRHQTDPAERMKALVCVAGDEHEPVVHADILLQSGVNIDTPGMRHSPLQTAALYGHINMVLFLLRRGANVNAAPFPGGGRTALQAALEGESPIEVGRIMLRNEADISAPPAMIDGRTALEAYSHGFNDHDEASDRENFFGELLDAGAEINRPNEEPSSVLHGVIANGWHKILARCLETRYKTIANHMWCNEEFSRDEPQFYKPYTPTQLAASAGDMIALEMLLEYGTGVNEPPGDRFGRTTLQAACERSIGPDKTALINFLLDRGSDVNAEAGLLCGVTALQAAAITGDIKIVELLISKGADVNAMASFEEGRYAIEGAAEHGRLDTVQMLLNAGAKGNVGLGTGFAYAIELAEKEGHFAVANLLKTEGPGYLAA